MERLHGGLLINDRRARGGDLLAGVLRGRKGPHFGVRRRHRGRVGGPERAGGEGGGGEAGGELEAAGRAEDVVGGEQHLEGAEAGDQAGAAEERAENAAKIKVRRAHAEGCLGQSVNDESEDADKVRRRVERQQQDLPRGAGGNEVPVFHLHFGAIARTGRDGGEFEGADSVHGQAL